MNVYVESNFVLEHALAQEQFESCDELIQIAASRSINLVIPAFSLAEPHIALMRKRSERAKLNSELRRHLSDLARSKYHREDRLNVDDLAAVLSRSIERENEALDEVLERILEVAEIIPLDSALLRKAGTTRTHFGMSAQDAIVLASILAHLELTTPRESCFLNRNT